jgi:hypothetical protein
MAKAGPSQGAVVHLLGRIAFFMQVIADQLCDLAIVLHYQNVRSCAHGVLIVVAGWAGKRTQTHRPPQVDEASVI